jgi:hypothetical protein
MRKKPVIRHQSANSSQQPAASSQQIINIEGSQYYSTGGNDVYCVYVCAYLRLGVHVGELLEEEEDLLLAAVLGGPVKRSLAILLIMQYVATQQTDTQHESHAQ